MTKSNIYSIFVFFFRNICNLLYVIILNESNQRILYLNVSEDSLYARIQGTV